MTLPLEDKILAAAGAVAAIVSQIPGEEKWAPVILAIGAVLKALLSDSGVAK